MTEAVSEQKEWKPEERLVDYVCAVIESLCWLWEDGTKPMVANVCERKLDSAWQAIWRTFPAPHQEICAKVFWDQVTCRYPNRCCYRVVAVFGATVNMNNDAKHVSLDVRPVHVGEIIRLNLRYRSV